MQTVFGFKSPPKPSPKPLPPFIFTLINIVNENPPNRRYGVYRAAFIAGFVGQGPRGGLLRQGQGPLQRQEIRGATPDRYRSGFPERG